MRGIGPQSLLAQSRSGRNLKVAATALIAHFPLARIRLPANNSPVLLFHEKVPADWLPKVIANLPPCLLDHAHLERKAATTALTLERYPLLYDRASELNAIAIEELEHFELVLQLMKKRNIPFGPAVYSPWISGLMKGMRKGRDGQLIDHLICCALVEGRSCEKFQILAASEELRKKDAELSDFYASLVESEGNHYATYILMARAIDEAETNRRLQDFLELDAELIRQPNPLPMLH